jgi:hypothetical protein
MSKYWTKDPADCPCLRLVTNNEFIAINKKNIEEEWQYYFYNVEGWYRVLNRNYKRARELSIKSISYQIKNHIDYNQNEEEIKIIDSLLMNYKFDLQNLNFIKKSGIVNFSDDLLNDIINYGHTYVIEGDLPLAKSIYILLDLNYTSEKYEMSIKAIIFKDLDEFKSKGLITKNIYDDLINYINKSQ